MAAVFLTFLILFTEVILGPAAGAYHHHHHPDFVYFAGTKKGRKECVSHGGLERNYEGEECALHFSTIARDFMIVDGLRMSVDMDMGFSGVTLILVRSTPGRGCLITLRFFLPLLPSFFPWIMTMVSFFFFFFCLYTRTKIIKLW